MHYLSCPENSTVSRINDNQKALTNEKWIWSVKDQKFPSKWWALLTPAGPEPVSCSRSTFWLVWLLCWTAQKMWKSFLSHRLNILHLFANTHYSSVLVPYWHLVWNLNSQAESLFKLHWYHHSTCQGIQMCSIHLSLVWE